MNYPNKNGYFGIFGGRYVGETLMTALIELEDAYTKISKDKKFQNDLNLLLKNYVGRPTPLYFAERLSKEISKNKVSIFLKREDLSHTGAHKINNTIGQGLLAKYMGKKKIIAETGAGQHGVATATVAAIFGMECKVFMGEEDIKRQAPNVKRMQLLGTEVIPVLSGSRTLKDAMNEALRYWSATVEDTFYVIGSVAGPHPYPLMVRNFQKIIGIETKKQIKQYIKKTPDILIACVGGGSNAMGLFYPFLNDNVEMIGVEAAGLGLNTNKYAATLCKGNLGVLHGSKSYVLQDENGQIKEAHSISAGLDYPGVGPEHSLMKELKRIKYVAVQDDEALMGLKLLSEYEGIIPALESAHAIFYGIKIAKESKSKKNIVINLSGRGDKDIDTILKKV